MISRKDGFPGERQVVLPPLLVEMEEKDELCESLFITDIGHYPRAEHHHCRRAEGINQYVLIYCVDGRGYYVIDGERHEVNKNQYFILPAWKTHEYGASEGGWWSIYWVHFRGACAHVYAEGASIPQTINIAVNSRISDRIDIFEEILTTLTPDPYASSGGREYSLGIEDMRYASSLLHHFLASMRYLGQFRRAKAPLSMRKGNEDRAIDIVEQAIHYMRENIENRITLSDVLQYIGYSQSHFSALFKKKTGQSPLFYFNRMKVEYACRLLKTTDLKVNQICYKVGIDDPLYFSRMFSKIVGMSPTKYKESYQ